MSLIQEEVYDEPVFKPYKFRAEVGDCADRSSPPRLTNSETKKAKKLASG